MTKRDILNNLKSLKELEAAGRPQAAWVLSSREIMMNQIQPRATEESSFVRGESVYYWHAFSQWFGVRVLRPAMAIATIIAMMLGYTATVTIANASLPGDMLYPIKTAGEKVQLALTFSDDEKVKLQMNFITTRADEIKQIAKTDDSATAKIQKVSATAKRITADVKAVNDKINKITASATTNAGALQVAKEVDTKTLQVTQDLAKATASLPQEVKKDVAKDITEAIAKTEAAGTNALGVIVKKFESDGSTVGETEVATRVADRIKNTEENIQTVAKEVNSLLGSATVVTTNLNPASTTAATSTITVTIQQPILATASSTATSTLQNIIDKPVQAQATLEQAKDLLDQKNFSSALEKVQESKQTVANVSNAVQAISSSLPQAPSSTVKIEIKNDGLSNGTSTLIIINNTNATTTSAGGTTVTTTTTPVK